jgi:Fic family protein
LAVYVHHSKKGPDFAWDQARIVLQLAEVRYRQGRLLGRMEGMAPHEQGETADNWDVLLTRELLASWETGLDLPGPGHKSVTKTAVHFRSSALERSEGQLTKFINWFNSDLDSDPVIKAAVAHLWLLLIGPSGAAGERLAIFVTEMQLARASQYPQRFLNLSIQMSLEQKEYRQAIAEAKKALPDATNWVLWFLGCFDRAIAKAEESLGQVLNKYRLLQRYLGMSLNERQRMMLDKLLDGEVGKVSSSQWAELTETSQDTAGRDINDLLRRGVLEKAAGGGRSTSYVISP